MVSIIDDYLKSTLITKLKFLKSRPELIDTLFTTMTTRISLDQFKEYLTNTTFRVLTEYPRDQEQLPCFVICLNGEQELPEGLGEDESYEDYDESENENEFLIVNSVFMQSDYRIECWADNADLVVYMYYMAKWCLLSARNKMLEDGFLLPKISGGSIEPMQDFLPNFIYRRAVLISFQLENSGFTVDDTTIPSKVNIKSTFY